MSENEQRSSDTPLKAGPMTTCTVCNRRLTHRDEGVCQVCEDAIEGSISPAAAGLTIEQVADARRAAGKMPYQAVKPPETPAVQPEPAAESAPNRLVEIRKQRGSQYGPIGINQDGIGEVWRGLLMHAWQRELPPLPGHVVALMLVGMKIARASYPSPFHQDNYDDARVYTDIAEELAKRNSNGNQENKSHVNKLDAQPAGDDLRGVETQPKQ